MQLKSIQEVETLKATIRKVDAEIMHRRLAIRNNTVANAGIARSEVEMMARQQQQRKAYLHAFRGQIEALYHADGGRFNRMRTSFVQPRTPKSERISINETQEKSRQFKTFARDPKTGEYYLSGRKVSKAEYMAFMLDYRQKRQEKKKQQSLTRKQRKKTSPPPPSIDMTPMPKPLPAKPPQRLNEAADKARQDAHVLAANKAEVIRKQLDAKRDAELVAQGKAKLVAQRRASEVAKKQEEMKRALSRQTTQLTNKVTKKAASAERSARSMASRFANKKISNSRISRGRFQPSRRGSRGTGLVPQLAVMMSLTDKRRAATVNQVTRTPDKVIPGPIRDQITEDVRQYKPVKQTRSTEYLNFVKEVQTAEKEGHNMIQAALAGREVMGFKIDLEVLGPQRTQYWTSRAYALMAQVKKLVLDEAIRWDQGAFNTGVAVSTDTRSQSKRKMSLNDFKRYLGRKLQPIIEPVFNEFQEELVRAYNTKGVQLGRAYHKVTLGNSLPVNKQRSLASADKLRGHGRPVLSEQQGTKGLAGLFPALRSSMQGALKR
jgi:hypothetical protein